MGVAWKFQASTHGLVFLWPAPIQEPTKSYLVRIKDTPITQAIPRDLEAALCQELGPKSKY